MSESFNQAILQNLPITYTDLYLATSKCSLVSIVFSNASQNTVFFSTVLTDNLDNILYRFAINLTLPTGALINIVPERIAILPNQKIRVLASEINTVDAILTIVEGVP